MRKLLSALSSTLQGGVRGGLLFLTLLATTTLWAYDFQSGDLYYNITSDTTVEVTYQYELSSDNYAGLTTATIPETVTYNGTTYSVTSIGNSAFDGCSDLTSVTIPNSVTSIGNYAFDGCNKLTAPVYNTHCFAYMPKSYNGAYTIPDGIKQIAGSAFSGCSSLTSLTIPNSVTSIGGWAFSGCSSLTSITIPNSVTSIGIYAFRDCSSLSSITIPNSVTSIGSGAFYDCSSLTSITIPEGVTSIRDEAFRGCSSLTSITIPNSVTSIGIYAFRDCSSLSSITIPNSVTSIGSGAFYDCSSLTSITIPNSVTSIGDWAFDGCSSLTSITIGNSVTSIGTYAFYNCSSLTSITLPNSATTLGQSVFENCISLKSAYVGNGITSLDNGTFLGCSSLKSVTLGDRIVNIGEDVFSGCSALNEIKLPASIKSIGENAFAGCTKLYDIYCFAMEPPTAYESSFANYNAFLHVPCDNQRVYLLDILFGNFKYVECIEAETTTTDTVIVNPSFNDAEFTWPSNSNADSYTIVISKDSEVFRTLIFNANGQLTSIAFAPSRNGQHNTPAATQMANGFAFTVTGLDEGSNYTYELLIQDRSGNTLRSYSGKFRTQSTNDRTVTVEYDAAQGQVTGAGTYLVGDTVTLTAIPNNGYRFVRWSNEVEDNPYTFVISDNVTLSAEFEAVIPSSLENTNSQSPMSNCQKIIHNGQLLILRDGKTYTIMGAEIQ